MGNLAKLANSYGKSSASSNFSGLSETFGQIASGLNVSNTSFDLYITPSSSGTVYKMTFDDVSNEADSEVHFTGTYQYSGGTYTLNNINYVGMTGSLDSITGTVVGNKVKFAFGTLSLDNNGTIVKDYIQQWFQSPGSSSWQRNSEYDQNNTATVTKNSAVIYLVLDSSKSLTDDNITAIKEATKNFIDVLYARSTGVDRPSSAPTSLNAAALSVDSIKLTWSSVSGATSYKIYRATSATSTYTAVGSSSTPSYTDGYLSPQTTYYYKVAAVNGVGEGPLSSYASAKTPTLGTGSGYLRIHNYSTKWDFVYVGVWDVTNDEWWKEVTEESDVMPLEPGYYLHWPTDGVPAGKYWVKVVDSANGQFETEEFYLATGETKHVSYDGYSLKVEYD